MGVVVNSFYKINVYNADIVAKKILK